LVIGDDKAEVNGYGAICYNQGSEVIDIGNGFKLSSLLNLKD
jgi:hypothetical protein